MAISWSKSEVTTPLLCVCVFKFTRHVCFLVKIIFLRIRICEVAFDSSYRGQLKLIWVTAIGTSSKFYSDRKYKNYEKWLTHDYLVLFLAGMWTILNMEWSGEQVMNSNCTLVLSVSLGWRRWKNVLDRLSALCWGWFPCCIEFTFQEARKEHFFCLGVKEERDKEKRKC